jgi:hypothetical protein
MGASFEIIGTLKAIKDNDKFSAMEVRDFESGWQTTRYRWSVLSGTSRFMVEIGGGKWSDESKNRILTFAKAEPGKKSEKLEVKWSDRKNPEIIEKVAGFKIYTCNLLTYDEQDELKAEGREEEVNKKNHQFLEQTEYAALVKRVIDSGKYNDAKFRITGTIDFQYSAKDNRFYRALTVQKMYKVPNDTPCKAEMTINTFYTEDAIDDTLYDDTQKYIFNCYTDYYFSSIKANRFVPMSLIIKGSGDEKATKRAEAFKKKLTEFDDEATVRKCGLVVDMIDGAEEQAISYDDLDDDTKDNVDLGLISLEDAIKGLGGSIYGPRVTEYRVKALARNSAKGSEATVYSEENLKKLPVVEEAEESVDIFEEDEDI